MKHYTEKLMKRHKVHPHTHESSSFTFMSRFIFLFLAMRFQYYFSWIKPNYLLRMQQNQRYRDYIVFLMTVLHFLSILLNLILLLLLYYLFICLIIVCIFKLFLQSPLTQLFHTFISIIEITVTNFVFICNGYHF